MAKLNTVTSSTRPASPAAGEAYFETDTNKIIVWDGSAWTEIVSDTAPSLSNTYSVDFDGTNDNVAISYDSSLDITGALSITAWVKFDSLSGFPMIYAIGDYFDGYAGNGGHQFYSSSNKVAFFDTGTGGAPSFSSTTLSTGTWYHLAVTRSASRGITFYVNGSSAGTDTRTGSPSTGTLDIKIGSDAGPSNYLNGLIDEVAVFNSVLSASDITSIYNSGTPADLTSYSPVGWWRMGDNDSGSGTTITDQGSGGNDGAFGNSPTFSTDVPT